MTYTECKVLAEKWIKLWNLPINWKLFIELHSLDFINCSSAGRPSNRIGFAKGIECFIKAFPNIKTVIEDLVIEEKRSIVAVRWKSIGINKVKYLGVGPTNKGTIITGIEIIEFKNNQIIKRWGEWDISNHLTSSTIGNYTR